MALQKDVQWKGITWKDAYCKISFVIVSDVLINGVKVYTAGISVSLFSNSTKENTVDVSPCGNKYDFCTPDMLELTYENYYEFLKTLPDFAGWVDC